MNTQQNQSQKNEQGKQNLKQPQQTGTKQTQSANRQQDKQQNPTQKHK